MVTVEICSYMRKQK